MLRFRSKIARSPREGTLSTVRVGSVEIGGTHAVQRERCTRSHAPKTETQIAIVSQMSVVWDNYEKGKEAKGEGRPVGLAWFGFPGADAEKHEWIWPKRYTRRVILGHD